ncbi:MAG TPA: hypothetical protein DCZ30_04705 [Clostridiales bacterium]|nr:hypothetical protein [Clostridiales bacterium]
MSIISGNRGDFELKSVIEEMYYCREDEIIHISEKNKKYITIDELNKLPEDIRIYVIEKLKNRGIVDNIKREGDVIDENLYKRFYSTWFKDGVMTIIESLM